VSARIMLIVGVVLGAAALYAGLDYYALPLSERPFSPLHAQFAPTGLIGQGFGIVGTLMIALGVGSYGLRKRVRWLSRFGKLKSWLHFHIFLCLLGPFLVLLHTTFKFGGLVAIAFWCMTVVVASGVIGRWVYVWIPKTANGRFLGRDEVRGELQALLRDIESRLGMTSEELLDILNLLPTNRTPSGSASAEPISDRRHTPRRGRDRRGRPRSEFGVFGALMDYVRYRLTRRRERTRFRKALANAGVPEPIRSGVVAGLQEERRIEQQLRMLEPFQAVFRYWHAFHLPLAMVMTIVLVVHVGVAIAFGYTWIWAR
jgi:hypothetical protein